MVMQYICVYHPLQMQHNTVELEGYVRRLSYFGKPNVQTLIIVESLPITITTCPLLPNYKWARDKTRK